MVRLNKFLASTGKFSRRLADQVIAAGKVKVNGRLVTKLGTLVDPKIDQVFCYGKIVSAQPKKLYLMLNKPIGYVTTKNDPQGRPTVMALVPKDLGLFPVGRLDQDSEGLLLFTNDGDWAQKLLHPRFQKQKEYLVTTKEQINAGQLRALRQGVVLTEGLVKSDQLCRVSNYQFSLVIHQGYKRQVRRMAGAVGLTVLRLVRIRFGHLFLSNLPSGQWRFIKPDDV